MIKAKGQEVQKIMTRTKNLFNDRTASGYAMMGSPTFKKQDNGLTAMSWGQPFWSTEQVQKTFKQGKTYTVSFDIEVVSLPSDNEVSTEPWGFRIYNKDHPSNSISFRKTITPSNIKVGYKEHICVKNIINKDISGASLLLYSGYIPNVNTFITTRFSNIMLTEGTEEVDYVPYMSEVKTVAWGVKDECKLILNGNERWWHYSSGTAWIGIACSKRSNAINLRDAQYTNYWGFQAYENPDKFLWMHPVQVYIAWRPGSPPFPSWETTDADGKAIANIPQVKADLAKKNIIVYYDNINSKPKTLAQLLKIVRREVYNNFSATVDSDILTLTNSLIENNVLILPDDKTVTNNVLNL